MWHWCYFCLKLRKRNLLACLHDVISLFLTLQFLNYWALWKQFASSKFVIVQLISPTGYRHDGIIAARELVTKMLTLPAVSNA